MSDYNDAPILAREWGAASTPCAIERYKKVQKYFVVADTQTGRVLANVTIGTDVELFPSMIIPGSNNDVFMATSNQIIRVHV